MTDNIAEIAALMTWNSDMDAAPRDGRWIIGSVNGEAFPICWESDADADGHQGWCGAGSSYGGVLYDLHYRVGLPKAWMPLPPPPGENQ